MADITGYIRTIQLAARGEDVRDAIVAALLSVDERSAISVDEELSGESANPVENRAVSAALSGKQDALVFDPVPTEGSSNPVTSGSVHEALEGKQPVIRTAEIALSSSWSGSGPYTQAVALEGVTGQTKGDLQPDADVLVQLMGDGVTALWIENDDGVLTACALGSMPLSALSIQCSLTEVAT